MSIIKANGVIPISPTELLVHFEDGFWGKYDVSETAKEIPKFKELIEKEYLFRQAHIDTGGYAIVWDEEFDLDIVGVRERSIPMTVSIT